MNYYDTHVLLMKKSTNQTKNQIKSSPLPLSSIWRHLRKEK